MPKLELLYGHISLDLKKMYNMTIFVTTHYLEEADFYCNRIAIIDKGK